MHRTSFGLDFTTSRLPDVNALRIVGGISTTIGQASYLLSLSYCPRRLEDAV